VWIPAFAGTTVVVVVVVMVVLLVLLVLLVPVQGPSGVSPYCWAFSPRWAFWPRYLATACGTQHPPSRSRRHWPSRHGISSALLATRSQLAV
jgi:hypothetical protein